MSAAQLTLLQGERPEPRPAHPMCEAWWVRPTPRSAWWPVVVSASATYVAGREANPAQIYGPLPELPAPLDWFLLGYPESEWRRLPWPEGQP